jgi:membrane protease YdiL (CAAX protease family)
MVHFQKTAAESVGSIVAGLLLGYLAMRSRSLWGGVLVHWCVAIEMDLMSLMQTQRWPPP